MISGKNVTYVMACVLCLSSFENAQAVTVETTDFLANPTNFNSFDGADPNPPMEKYAEGGIIVTYHGEFPGRISSSTTPAAGRGAWYTVQGGGSQAGQQGRGYTSIGLAGGSAFSDVQFLTYSGWGVGDPVLIYTLLYQGVIQASGVAGPVSRYTGNAADYRYYGFSGGTFDELRIEVQSTNLPQGFEGFSGYDAGLYDSVAIRSVTAIPEPASWALMLTGIAVCGFRVRRANIGTVCQL